MKTVVVFILFILSGSLSFAQQALSNMPPKVFGSVKTIRYKYRTINFSQDKTRIEELISNGRKVIWLFDTQGKILSSEIFESNGRFSGTKSLYNYDSEGRLTSIADYLLGSPSFTTAVTYPEADRVKITRVFEPNKDSEVEIDDYDSKRNIVKATFYEGQNLDQVEFYKYDDKGNPTEFVVKDVEGQILIKETYQYKFDAHGNWTTKRENSTVGRQIGIPETTTIKRKIIYY